jgi:hypothetical protein
MSCRKGSEYTKIGLSLGASLAFDTKDRMQKDWKLRRNRDPETSLMRIMGQLWRFWSRVF